MPNVPVSDKAMESTVRLAERIEACGDPLARAAAQAGECHETAGIFGWGYGAPGFDTTDGAA
ncbi:hypothetical protein [Streptomyces sp. NPDC048411]|uniref:hypothetical protein n=1 Tax=Streptomyces sp. NPDC048411 TaxID=3157206 RepID=UPI003453E43B